MTKPIPYQPDRATSPGEVLEAYLAAQGMTKAELASRCGRPTKTISEIIHAKAAITPETALQLERVLGRPASLWQDLEARYRLDLAAAQESQALATHGAWARAFPWKALVERGDIEAPEGDADLVGKLLRFFGVGTPAGWHSRFGQMHVAYRRSPAFVAVPEAVSAWLRLGEREAEAISCERFDKRRFLAALAKIRRMTARDFDDVCESARAACAAAGVALVFVRELPKTHLSGIARWLGKDKALIQLSARYRSNDHLWFSFFHEAGHILLHGKKTIFIDVDGGDRNELENEANRFARDLLIAPAAFAQLRAAGTYTEKSVTAFARKQGIAPGIVVGRLQHDGLITFASLNGLKQRLVWPAE